MITQPGPNFNDGLKLGMDEKLHPTQNDGRGDSSMPNFVLLNHRFNYAWMSNYIPQKMMGAITDIYVNLY